jgi:hypothetical protein
MDQFSSGINPAQASFSVCKADSKPTLKEQERWRTGAQKDHRADG